MPGDARAGLPVGELREKIVEIAVNNVCKVGYADLIADQVLALLSEKDTAPVCNPERDSVRAVTGQEVATDADRRWLEAALNRLREPGHCGEGTLERKRREAHNARIDRLLASQAQSVDGSGPKTPAVPGQEREGWVLVPREPSEEMLRKGFSAGRVKLAGHACYAEHCPLGAITPATTMDVWNAMLSALPPPPTGKGD